MNIPTQGPQEVICTEVVVIRFSRGDGTPESPHRSVTQVWSKLGIFIAEDDPALTASEKS